MAEKNLEVFDVILHKIEAMEDQIANRKRKLDQVHKAIREYERERISLLTENKEMEEGILRTRRSLIHTQTRLSSNLLLLRHLEKEMIKVEQERKECLQQLEAEISREKEATGAWTKKMLRDHYSKVRLDNPAIPARREAILQEVAQLTLEETRQNCEIKVLEDMDKEREKLEKRVKEEEEEQEEMRRSIAELKEKSESVKSETRLLEERRDSLYQCPSEEQEEAKGLKDKLSDLQQEREYLMAALEAMKEEWKQLVDKYGLSELPEGTPNSHSTSHKRPKGSKEPLADTILKKQRTHIPSTSFSASPTEQGHENSNLDMDAEEYINEMLRDINWGNEGDLSDTHAHPNDGGKGVTAEKTRTSGRKTGPSPSTPRTFTRNPAPPTPDPSNERRPLLQHILANQPPPTTHPATTSQQEAQTTPVPSRQHQHHSLITTTSSIASCSFSSSSAQYPCSNTTTTHQMYPRFTPTLPYARPSQSHHMSSQQPLPRPRSSHPLPPPCPFVYGLPSLPHPHSSATGALLPGSQSGPQRSISSNLMQEKARCINPVPSISSSSSSSLVSGQHFQRPTGITGLTWQHPMHSTVTKAGTQCTFNTLESVAPSARTSLVQTLRPSQQAVITNQGARGVRLSSFASTTTPRLRHHATTTPVRSSVLPAQSTPVGRGLQKPQGLQQGIQKQQQGYKFGMWKTSMKLTSPSRRRIRFNETAEVLGTPDSTDGR
ncbi:MAP7 domain-containing protein 1-like [Portunus trituberculatus]|uniref:MAP7 domain-containing protein 1-like n=1 Tax=Portunus trituberculatus TaxID=210409 RepID=UPI001E1CD24C|nr:MAP7 domain-containing protein 1-like [Portunus trituberculatus]